MPFSITRKWSTWTPQESWPRWGITTTMQVEFPNLLKMHLFLKGKSHWLSQDFKTNWMELERHLYLIHGWSPIYIWLLRRKKREFLNFLINESTRPILTSGKFVKSVYVTFLFLLCLEKWEESLVPIGYPGQVLNQHSCFVNQISLGGGTTSCYLNLILVFHSNLKTFPTPIMNTLKCHYACRWNRFGGKVS